MGFRPLGRLVIGAPRRRVGMAGTVAIVRVDRWLRDCPVTLKIAPRDPLLTPFKLVECWNIRQSLEVIILHGGFHFRAAGILLGWSCTKIAPHGFLRCRGPGKLKTSPGPCSRFNFPPVTRYTTQQEKRL